METPKYETVLADVVDELCREESYRKVFHRISHEIPMPSVDDLELIVEKLREVIFPGYFGNSELKPQTMPYYLGTNIDGIFRLLSEQIKRGFCFECNEASGNSQSGVECADCEGRAAETAEEFLRGIPEIRRLLATSVQAAYEGDPAAKSYGEAIFCYPSIFAMTNYRIAHELLKLEVPLIPRIISEMAHSRTGMDIHPGAKIGERFFVDHCTGTVIGETCEIGNNVRLYHGVTLGAKSFPLDANGNPIKGIPRHPVVEDDVIIYSGATILGRVTIGAGAEIGGNVWLTHSVPPGGKVAQSRPFESRYDAGGGI